MANQFNSMPEPEKWTVLVGAAKRAVESHGLVLRRSPGRGRSNVWVIEENGRKRKLSIRTTQTRRFAFPPLERGTKWRTLDQVDEVIVAAVNDRDDPRQIHVYRFAAAEVRSRFDAAYQARTKAGLTVSDNCGMWVSLDEDHRGPPRSVGAGLARKHKPIATYPIEQLVSGGAAPGNNDDDAEFPAGSSEPDTIAEVVEWAKRRIASLSGVRPEAVRLDLKIEY